MATWVAVVLGVITGVVPMGALCWYLLRTWDL